MDNISPSRRRFLAGAAATAGLGLTARNARAAPGANERISIGVIGCGGRGNDHIRMIAAHKDERNARVAGLCDVWKLNLDRTAAKVKELFGEAPATCTRFGELLGNKDIDAVTIATADFAHGPILVAALEAGKDVYVEKPMTIQLEYANKALDIARGKSRVVQVGTQYRSQPALRGVAREIAAGAIGKISRVTTAVSFNHPRWKRSHDDCVEADVDWDAYLLDLPKRPFDAGLLREWHLHKETSNGLPGLWMVHYVDAMAMMMGVSYPKSAVAHGGIFAWNDGREHADTFTALFEYPEGFLFDWAMSLGTGADFRLLVCGKDGTIAPQGGNLNLSASKWVVSPRGAYRPAKDATDRPVAAVPTGDHMVNWLECMRTRERPRADIQHGHEHAVASIMAAEALTSGRRQIYDADNRRIVAA